MAVKDNNKLYWNNYINNVSGSNEPIRAYTSFYSGAAGIGTFLVNLHKESAITSINDHEQVIAQNNFVLNQNYPNPFNSETTISYELAVNSNVKILLMNIHGQEIMKIDRGKQHTTQTK